MGAKASGIIDKIKTLTRDVRDLKANQRPVDIIKLVYHTLFLVLSIVHGEPTAVALVGIHPLEGDRQDLTFWVAKTEVVGHGIRKLKEVTGKLHTCLVDGLFEQLPLVDIDVLQLRISHGGAVVEELKAIMAIEKYTSENAYKASSLIGHMLE